MQDYSQYEHKGICPICDRDMYAGSSINRHHFIPKSRGGKVQEYVHTLYHNKIHSLWTEKQLELDYSDPQLVRSHPDMKVFIEWVKKKDPLFYIKTKSSSSKKRRR